MGKTVRQVLPNVEPYWFEMYDKVIKEGKSLHDERYNQDTNRWYDMFYFPYSKDKVGVLFRDITEHQTAEIELVKKNGMLKLFSDAASLLLSSENPEKIVSIICNKTLQFLNCDVFFNYLFNEERQLLHLNAYGGVPEEIGKSIEWLDLGTAVCGCVGRDGCRIIAKDILNTFDERTELVKSFGVQAYACHPIISKGQTIGTLSFGTKSRPSFNDDELEVMRTITDYVATAMERKLTEDKLKKAHDHLEEQVEERTAELERSNQELESFAYITSHDLQEPLRTMGSYAQLLKRRYEGQLDSDADEFIDYMVDGASRMQDMIKGLLEYSRVGTQEDKFEIFNTEEVLTNALNNLKSAINDCSAEITFDKLPTVNADKSQISRVFQNLIGNALKFRKEGIKPEIHISARKEENEYVFSISDNGIGIEEQYINSIFEVFKRLHTVSEYDGAGIGLSIVKRIINLHNGHIWVESEYGEGSTFYFTIPVNEQ